MVDIKPIDQSQIVPRQSVKNTASVQSETPTAANPEAPRFISPKGNIDAESGVFVVQIRNTSTGEVSFQYPANKAATEYSKSAGSANEGSSTPQTAPPEKVESRSAEAEEAPKDSDGSERSVDA